MKRRPSEVFARAARIAASLAVIATAGAARGDEPANTPPSVSVRAGPIFGGDASGGDGWNEVAVSVENIGGTAKKGTIELAGTITWGREGTFATVAPFNVQPGRSVVVKMPTHASAYQSGSLTVTVKEDNGTRLAATTVNIAAQSTPTLIDVDQPSRLSVVMRNWPLSIMWSPTYSGSVAGHATLSAGAPSFDRTTGDPILPDHPAAYASATVVLIHSDTLAKIEPRPLEALLDWVITGGTIAIVPNRPEDLRERAVVALIGGEAHAVPPPPFLLSLPAVPRPSAPGTLPSDPPEAPEEGAPTPLHFVPTSTTTRGQAGAGRAGPTTAVRTQLSGYAGGNLSPSVFGASAAYGTGEVHLLAFDPTSAPGLDDPWAHSRIVDLVTHAWDRRAALIAAPGAAEHNDARIDEVRRALDPNENFRPALGVAAVLLVIYSIIAGPFTFLRAARRGRPLLPLLRIPIFSAATFALIVVVGLAGKGWRGRSRRIALVEAGAGVARGSIRRFRGFFTSNSHALAIAATDGMSLPRVATHDSAVGDATSLQLDRDQATIAGLTSLPWQTIVVREDGMIDLKNGVSVISSPGGTDVVNRTGRALRDVLVYTPGDGVRHFPAAADGETLHSPSGKLLAPMSRLGVRTTTAGLLAVHPLDAAGLGMALGGKEGDALTRTWRPIETATGDSSEWWPDDAPVVLAEIPGGEETRHDSGLAVESDALLVRIVGRGGAP